MTTQDLIIKLEECRSNMEDSTDDLAQTTFDTLNEIISDLENEGVIGNEYFSSGKHSSSGRY